MILEQLSLLPPSNRTNGFKTIAQEEVLAHGNEVVLNEKRVASHARPTAARFMARLVNPRPSSAKHGRLPK